MNFVFLLCVIIVFLGAARAVDTEYPNPSELYTSQFVNERDIPAEEVQDLLTNKDSIINAYVLAFVSVNPDEDEDALHDTLTMLIADFSNDGVESNAARVLLKFHLYALIHAEEK